MFFLLNDVVLTLDGDDLSNGQIARRFGAVPFNFVQQLGQELFAQFPLLQRTNPSQAVKLATLGVIKKPEINAALFMSPGAGCKPDQVGVRFAAVDVVAMSNLRNASAAGSLDAVSADREVWRRLAA